MSSGVDIDRVHEAGPGRGWHGQRGQTHQVRQWFLANPHELLSYEDMEVKFDISPEQARNICATLRKEGLIYTETLTGLNPERPR